MWEAVTALVKQDLSKLNANYKNAYSKTWGLPVSLELAMDPPSACAEQNCPTNALTPLENKAHNKSQAWSQLKLPINDRSPKKWDRF